MARQETIAIYRLRPPGRSEWRWHWRWKSANGHTVAASNQGYASRADCIANLEKVSGGYVRLDYQLRVKGGWYCQGYLLQQFVDTFLHISP